MMLFIQLLSLVCVTVLCLWPMLAVIGRLSRQFGALPPHLEHLRITLFMWMKVLYLPCLPMFYVTFYVMSGIKFEPADSVLYALWLLYWFLFRRDGDDRWKKVRSKLRERVAQLHGRLVIVTAR